MSNKVIHNLCRGKKSLALQENLEKIGWSNKTLTDTSSWMTQNNYTDPPVLPPGEEDINEKYVSNRNQLKS